MQVYWYAMDDIEKDILHDAYAIFFIIMAFDRSDDIGQDSVDCWWFILQVLNVKASPWRLVLTQRLHKDFHESVGKLTFIIHQHCIL